MENCISPPVPATPPAPIEKIEVYEQGPRLLEVRTDVEHPENVKYFGKILISVNTRNPNTGQSEVQTIPHRVPLNVASVVEAFREFGAEVDRQRASIEAGIRQEITRLGMENAKKLVVVNRS